MLMPKKVKYRKQQRGRMRGKAWRGSDVSFGDYGLKAMEPCWLTDRQIEAARVAMTRFVKRGGKVWIRIFPDKPVTKKPAETRMGKGKGQPEYWVAVIRPGNILFELDGVSETIAANRGLGHLMTQAGSNFQMPLVFAGLIALGFALRRRLAARRWSGPTSRGVTPKISAAVARCTSSPRAKAPSRPSSPERWAMMRSSIWE